MSIPRTTQLNMKFTSSTKEDEGFGSANLHNQDGLKSYSGTY
jgi:hypothetical protein